MNIDELIGIAVANVGRDRVSIAKLEEAEIATEAVSGLAQLVAELVENAVAFSEPGQRVDVIARFVGDDYLISIADRGVGMSPHLLNALNHVLEDPTVHIGGPEPRLGIQLVARLASRNGIHVRLVPSDPGTVARVTLPSRLMRRVDADRSQSVFADTSTPSGVAHAATPRPVSTAGAMRTIDLTKYETPEPVASEPEIEEGEVEKFLESVFAPLRDQPVLSGRSQTPPAPTPRGAGPATAQTTLRVRVPGENFSLSDDEPSTTAGEGAVDIRKALSSYDDGRRSAVENDWDD